MVRIQVRRGTAASWTVSNPVLGAGEQGFETDTRKTKFGDGTSAWNVLPYQASGGGATTVDELTDATVVGKSVVKAANAAAVRTAIGAGTSNLALGTTSSTAKAGDYQPTAVQVVDLAEYIHDTVAGLLKAGTNVTTAYDDTANTFTINATNSGGGTTDPEVVRDTIGGALVAGSGISITLDDAGDTITIAVAGIPQTAVTGLTSSLTTLQTNIDAKYTKPGAGIPSTDLTTAAQTSLTKADNAAPLASPTFTGTLTTPALKITGGTIAAGKVLTADSTGNATWQDGTPGPAGPSGSTGWISVKTYGAQGNGSTDDTTAIANAYQACIDQGINDNPKALYFPSGFYRVTSLPAFANYSTITGDGQRATTILYEGTGTLCTLTGRQEVTFRHLGFWATGIGSTTLDLSGCFSTYLSDMTFRGQHGSGSGSTYRTQVGVNIRDNTGNTQIHHANFNNLGIGLRTRTIQNDVAQSKFAYCYQSILLTGNNANAGINLVAVEFDSAKDATTTDCHLTIDGSANEVNLVACWFEGGNVAAKVGVAGTGGPSSFKMFGGKMASRATYLQINHCARTLITGTEFNPDQQTPNGTNELSINGTYAAKGMVQMLMTTTAGRDEINRNLFPNSWTVIDGVGVRGTVVAP